MLANSVLYMITAIGEVGIVMSWGIWIWINKDDATLIGCPICGEDRTEQALFFFVAAYIGWFVINVPLKVASAINFQ